MQDTTFERMTQPKDKHKPIRIKWVHDSRQVSFNETLILNQQAKWHNQRHRNSFKAASKDQNVGSGPNPGNLHRFPQIVGIILPLTAFHCSVTQSCPTLYDPMEYSTPGFPVLYHLLELAQTHVLWVSKAIQPCHPLSSPPPAFNLSQHQGLF